MHLPWTVGTLGSRLPMAIGAKVALPHVRGVAGLDSRF
jgi:hypothetical protein